MINIRQAVLVFLSLLLLGCAAAGPRFAGKTKLEPNTAEIVVYRPDSFANGGKSFSIYLDGKEVAALKNAGFVSLQTTPGTHKLEIKSFALDFAFKTITTEVTLKEFESKYFRFHSYLSGGVVATPFVTAIPVASRFADVAESQAINELQQLRKSE